MGWRDHNKPCLINLRKEAREAQSWEDFLQKGTSTPFPFQHKGLFKMDDDTLDRIYTGHLVDLPRLSTKVVFGLSQGGITCGAIDEPWKSSKAIDESVIINFRNKNVVIAHFRDKNVEYYPLKSA